jgi:hypothetical protein
MLVFGCEENIGLMKELGCFQVLIWDKNHCGMGDLSDFGIGYEFIFYFNSFFIIIIIYANINTF